MPTPTFSESVSSSSQGPAFPEFAGQSGSLVDEAVASAKSGLAQKLANIDAYSNTLRAIKSRVEAQARGQAGRASGVSPQQAYKASLELMASAGAPIEAQIAQMLLAKNTSYDQLNSILNTAAAVKANLAQIQQAQSSSVSSSQQGGGGTTGGKNASITNDRRDSSVTTGFPSGVAARDDGWSGNFIGIGPGPGVPNPTNLGTSRAAISGTNAQNQANMAKRMGQPSGQDEMARVFSARNAWDQLTQDAMSGRFDTDISALHDSISGFASLLPQDLWQTPTEQTGAWNQWNNQSASSFEPQFSGGPVPYLDPARVSQYLNTPMGDPLIDPSRIHAWLNGGVPETNWNDGNADFRNLTQSSFSVPTNEPPVPDTVLWDYRTNSPGNVQVASNFDTPSENFQWED